MVSFVWRERRYSTIERVQVVGIVKTDKGRLSLSAKKERMHMFVNSYIRDFKTIGIGWK